jgi:hypothetical protein
VRATRLSRILACGDVVALLTGDRAVAVALLTLRPNSGTTARSPCSTSSTSRPSCSDEVWARHCSRQPRRIRQHGGELPEINVDGDDTGARRLYVRHHYVNSEPDEDQPLLCYYRELGNAMS